MITASDRFWWWFYGTRDRIFKINRCSQKVIHEYLPENPVVIEAGAHDGKDTVQMARWGGRVHAFEPVPEVFERLVSRTKGYRNITCHPIALGTSDGCQEMYVSSGLSDGSSSLMEPVDHLSILPKVYFNRRISVTTITLDTFVAFYGIEPDFLWLDLQGMELPVLQAGRKAIQSASAIYTEVSAGELYRGNTQYHDLVKWLSGQGFAVEIDATTDGYGNVLFVRRRP